MYLLMYNQYIKFTYVNTFVYTNVTLIFGFTNY